MKIIFAASFERDLSRVYEYLVANFDDKLAQEIMRKIRMDCEKIENGIGRSGKNYSRNAEWKVITIQKRNKVFYKIIANEVVIFRIFDSREDFWHYV